MGSALLDITADPSPSEVTQPAPAAGSTSAASAEALRLEVAERLAAHRSRRGLTHPQGASPSRQPTGPGNPRAARIAAAVAERYAHIPSYRAFLAAEAERVVQQARAAAEIAALNAQAIAAAQQSLLDALAAADAASSTHPAESTPPQQQPRFPHIARTESASAAATESCEPIPTSLWPDLEPAENAPPSSPAQRPGSSRKFQPPAESSAAKRAAAKSARREDSAHGGDRASLPERIDLHTPAGLTVRLYEDSTGASYVAFGPPPATPVAALPRAHQPRNDAEALALDEEIAFRQSPVFEEPAGPAMPLPANLIEFPRQLVASRKARPRLAEGPLREDADGAPEAGQLRIFEVDPAQISTSPAGKTGANAATDVAAQWTSIWLDTLPDHQPMDAATTREESLAALRNDPGCPAHPLPQIATIPRRIAAAVINAAILFAALAAFAVTFVFVAGRMLPPQATAPFTLTHAAVYALTRTGLAPAQLPAACMAAIAFLYLLYQALFFSFSAATPGMRCARIALCTFDEENPTPTAIRRRVLAVLLSACPLGLGLLWAALDEDRLSWHDRICRIYQRTY